eukprot:5732839-Lingulodinium_polyedra.AAC.1
MGPVVVAIRDLLPPELQAGWKRLHQDGWQRRVGVEEERAALWVGTNGAWLGFRPPDVAERSR